MIRLTFMDKHNTTRKHSRLPLYGAVACGVLVATGGLVLITRSSSPTPVADTTPSNIDLPTAVTTPDPEPAEFPNRQCFSSTEPAETVLYLDSAAPEDGPIGAFVFAQESPRENGADVRLVALAPQPDEAGDSFDVFVQVDDSWESQNWAQTSFGVVGPTLTWEPVDCTEVGDALALIEGFRNDIPLP